MGVRTLLSSVRRDVTTKAMELWEEATGDLTMTLNGGTVVTAETNPLTGVVIKTIWNGTQAEYDAIAVKDDNTLYVVV